MLKIDKAKENWNRVKDQISYDLSIIIPAYNEEARISKTVIEILEYFNSQEWQYEIIVVNDGSKDKTSDVIQSLIQISPQIRIINQDRNYGKGFAVKTGVLASRGKLVLFTDADGSSPIKELARLINSLEENSVAIGSRAKPSSETFIKTVWYRKFLGRCFNFFVNLLILPKIYDTQCGFKLFPAKIAHQIFFLQEIERFGFDLEILYIAKKMNFKIIEVPIYWVNVEGSKVNLIQDSIRMFKDIFKIKKIHKDL